jgi:hypothetical protein
MLGDMSADFDEPIVWLAPGFGAATLRKIASNAVMAGCLPSYFPVVLAAIRAVADPVFDLENCVTTVHSECPMVLVNGPIAAELEMNGGAGALGSGNRANATIGRAVSLCIRNIGQGLPGGLDATTIGHPGKYSYCFTETNESPWPQFHIDRGYPADASTVTVYAADAPLCICDFSRTEPEQVLLTVAESVTIPGSYNAFFRQDLWLVMSPEHAQIVAAAGWSKDDVRRFMHEHVHMSAGRLRERGLYGFADQVVQPDWFETAGPTDLISFVDAPERVNIAVAGGSYGGYTAAILGSGLSVTYELEAE